MNDKIKEKLLSFQIDHVDNICYSLKTYSRALDASDTGTGKSYSTIASCINLGLKPLIICPKSVLTTWKNVLKFFGAECYGIANYESIINCKYFPQSSLDKKKICNFIKRIEVIKTNEDNDDDSSTINIKFKNIKEKKEDKKEEQGIEYNYIWKDLPDDLLLVFDEAHRCKNPRTLNNLILKSASLTKAKILMLSATLSDKPENFHLAGLVLGLYKHLRHAKNWIINNSKGYDNPASAIHDAIYPEYASRMRIRDLGKLFPENQVVAQCYDMDNAEEIQKMYKLIEDEVEILKKKEDNSGCALSRILYARMRIEQLKIPTFIELVKKYIEEGASVAVFVNFTATIKTLSQELKTNCLVYGEQTLEERDKNIEEFNNDHQRIILCNIRSGGTGVSLHDTHGNYPRVSIISPSWSAQDILQALGRIHRAKTKTAVRQRIVFCSGTVEEMICNNMTDKIKHIANLNDGDLLSYEIEGLMDKDKLGVDRDAELTEFEKIFLKINTLNAKKERLIQDLKETEDEIKTLELLIQSSF